MLIGRMMKRVKKGATKNLYNLFVVKGTLTCLHERLNTVPGYLSNLMSDHWIELDLAGVWDWEPFSTVVAESTFKYCIIKGR